MHKRARIGIMGGTFDPIHIGHLVAAQEALVQFDLDKVVFMPAGRPALKGENITPAEHRYLMTVLATASNPKFEVSRHEVDRPGVTYTVDTLMELREQFGETAELFFITGADAVYEIVSWKDADRIADMVTFIAATRPGYDIEAARRMHEDAEHTFSIEYIEVPAMAVSSTDLRARIASGRPVRYLLPESVQGYIVKNALYTEGQGS